MTRKVTRITLRVDLAAFQKQSLIGVSACKRGTTEFEDTANGIKQPGKA
jgi:hypothetical protein